MRWGNERSARWETQGAAAASSKGRTATSHASANAKGSWVDVGSTTSFPYEMIIVSTVLASGATLGDLCIDIGINASGNRYVICPDLRVSAHRAGRGGGCFYQIPLHVPSGKQLSVRSAASVGSMQCEVTVMGCSRGVRGVPGYGRMISLYAPASSRGVDLDPATANTDTAWTEISASTADDVSEMILHIGQGGIGAKGDSRFYLLDLAVGAAASERSLIDDIFFGQDFNDDHPRGHYIGPLPMDLPAGSRLSARVRTDVITSGQDQIDVAAWGLL